MERKHEHTFHTAADAIVSAEEPATFEQRSIALPARDEIVMRGARIDIRFAVEEAMTKFVLKTLTAKHKRVKERLSAALESSIECIVRKIVSLPQAAAEVTKAAIDNTEVIAPNAAFVKSKERKCTDQKAKIEERS